MSNSSSNKSSSGGGSTVFPSKAARIAIISDIHSNYEALKSVLKSIKKAKVDKVICIGDIIGKGVNAEKCVDLVRRYCDVVIRGNVDDRYIQNPNDWKDDKVEYGRIKFHKALMREDQIEFLSQLPVSFEFYLSGNLVRLFHANPESCYKTVNNYEMDFSVKYKLFCPTEHTMSNKVADWVIFGHLLKPMHNCIIVGNFGL